MRLYWIWESMREYAAFMGPCSLVDASRSMSEVSNYEFIHQSIAHVVLLVQDTMDHHGPFIDKSGIEYLLKLVLRPSALGSSQGLYIKNYSWCLFVCLAKHHSAHLADYLCSFLRDNLQKAIAAFAGISGSSVLDSKVALAGDIFSSLFRIEFLLLMAEALEDKYWVTALLAEFGNGGSVLEDVGRVHRELLWQVALLEDAKFKVEDDAIALADELHINSHSFHLTALLSLPTSSLFVGFDTIAAIIIRNILADSHTLQDAMESQIWRCVASAPNGLTPRDLLLNLTPARHNVDIFLNAAHDDDSLLGDIKREGRHFSI
ncbi:hypothetical protein OROMI_028764 [Orobanche minor]